MYVSVRVCLVGWTARRLGAYFDIAVQNTNFRLLILRTINQRIYVKYIRVFVYIFTALHVMQTRYCDENSVCPSVRHTRVL